MIDLTASAVAGAVASLGLTTAALWAAGRFFGEKLFGHWLEERLQSQKQAHAVELTKLKSEQDRQIELLRADIGHLQDRGKLSNEREYAALTEIWEKFSDLHTATINCVMRFLQFPDLQQMNDDEVAKFLERNEFTEDEHAAVRNAASRNHGFSRVMHVRLIARARSASFDFRARFDKQNIFIPKSLADSLYEAADQCWRAIVQRDAEESGLRSPDMKDDVEFVQKGPGTLRRLNDTVRERLHRE